MIYLEKCISMDNKEVCLAHPMGVHKYAEENTN